MRPRRSDRPRPPAPAVGPRQLLRDFRWATRLAWSTSRELTAAVVGLGLLRSALPILLAFSIRGFTNVLVASATAAGTRPEKLWLWISLASGFTLVFGFTGMANRFAARRLADELNRRMSWDVVNHAKDLDLDTLEDPAMLDLVERAQHTAVGAPAQLVVGAVGALTHLAQLASLCALLVVVEPLVAGLVLLLGAPYLWIQFELARLQYVSEGSRATKRRWIRYVVGCLTHPASLPEVKLLDLAPLLVERLRSTLAEFSEEDGALLRRRLLSGSVLAAVAIPACVWLVFRVAHRALEGALTVGDVAMFGAAALRIGTMLEDTVHSITGFAERVLHVGDLRRFLAVPPGRQARGKPLPAAVHGEIRVERVSFSYPGQPEPALLDVSLHLRPGEIVALVGGNGAGKSTLAKLVAGLYTPSRGRVLLDGLDLRNLAPPDLYRRFGFVFQGVGRYEASIGENIAYGDWRRLLGDRARLAEIARSVGVHDMIEALPKGYATDVGRMFGDCDLSGGQWQRIAIARALARDAAVVILDEPTSNLDAHAEYELLDHFRDLARNRTCILITHRLSSVTLADRIVVLEHGRVIEEGTHHELLAQGGHYARLYDLHQRRHAPD